MAGPASRKERDQEDQNTVCLGGAALVGRLLHGSSRRTTTPASGASFPKRVMTTAARAFGERCCAAARTSAAVSALDPDPAMWATWKYSSIYCHTDCKPAAANVGLVHADLVAKTGGIGGDLCLQDFGPVFNELATAVAESVTLACEWDIPAVPMGETFDAGKTNVELTVNGVCAECGARVARQPDSAT